MKKRKGPPMIAHILRVAVVLALLTSITAGAEPATFDLRPHWDDSIPLANPHKGWYHHYFDNGMAKYLPQRDEDLLELPGMDHIYLRLAWAYLEPEEGRYNWAVIDRVIEKWTALGLKVSLRISCKETGTNPIEQQFATPRWVIKAGAKGGYYAKNREPGDPSFPWEPIYDDPVFLEKLDNFVRALAEHYDGKPWLRYVDVGSLGDWGEGHTSSGSNKKYDWQARLKHLEIHTRHFKKTLLVVSDDFVRGAPTEAGRQRLHRYIVDHGMSYRDDSILVDWWTAQYVKTFSVANPEYFEDVYRKTPTVLELQHLRSYTEDGKWEGRPGTLLAPFNTTGADIVRGAIRQMHATYLGYHGPAHEWMALPENPQLTIELLNRCGYWYFPHRVTLADKAASPDKAGGPVISVTWQNRGVAPAYHAYQLVYRLTGPEMRTVAVDARNQRWMPGEPSPIYTETYRAEQLANLPPGRYELAMKLDCPEEERPVLLPLRAELKDADDFYRVGVIEIPR
ncbi:MAG TPA: beta-galactosidase [Thermoguttaceae bacterium]|nr:beta-galactosidase [Thermoguttaceae bacterium]